MKIREIGKKYGIEIALFLVFCVELLVHVPYVEGMDSWCTTYYTVSYEFGFSSRLLIGSIVKLFFPQVTAVSIYFVVFCTALVLSLVTAVLAGHCIRRAPSAIRYMVIFLVALWIASPADISYLFQANTFGRMDTYLVLDTLLIFLVCLTWKSIRKWIPVAALVVLAVLTHQVYVFILFPLPAAIFVYEFFRSDNRRPLVKYGILLFGLCFGLALYLQLFSGVNVASAEEMQSLILPRANENYVNLTVLQFEYFAQFSDHWNYFGQYMIKDCIEDLIATVILLFPLLVFLVSLWKGYCKRVHGKNRAAVAVALACHVAYIPIFIITVDWGRWLAGLFIFEFLLILYIACSGDEDMTAALREKWEKICARPAVYVIMLVYLAGLGKFDAIDISSTARSLVLFVREILSRL